MDPVWSKDLTIYCFCWIIGLPHLFDEPRQCEELDHENTCKLSELVHDRIPTDVKLKPGWDALMCVYAVYHLRRSAKARTPSSSVSYHAFALVMDIALIPFMVITAFFSRKEWIMESGADGRWTSFFSTTGTNTLLLVTWITAVAVGSLHLLSIGLDVYLIIMFRKIARYPPDSNPLEDELSRRMASKHKHKNSELTSSFSEKRLTNMSSSTITVNRPMPFHQSRAGLDESCSGHTPETARMSRVNLYQQPGSARTSRVDFDPYSRSGSRPGTAHSRSQSRSRSRPRSQGGNNRYSVQSAHDPMPLPPISFLSGEEARSNQSSRYGTPLPGPQAALPADVAKLQQQEGLLSDNWAVLGDDDDGDLSSPRRTPVPFDQNDQTYQRVPLGEGERELSLKEEMAMLPHPLYTTSPTLSHDQPRESYGSNGGDNGKFYFSDMPINSTSRSERPTLDAYGNSHDASLPRTSYLPSSHPYATFDPTSPNSNDAHYTMSKDTQGTIGRALTVTGANSEVSSIYSQGNTPDVSRPASPKRKAYGDLASAVGGVRGSQSWQAQSSQGLAPPPPPHGGGQARGRSHSRERNLQRGHVEKGGRVVSRTGVDLDDASVMYLASPTASGANSKVASAASSLRGRQVSGKIAEEGLGGQRSGWWGGGVRRREVSGTA